MDKISQAFSQAFNEKFKRWGIQLPTESLEARKAGSLHRSGWMINYRFSTWEGRECLEYFASHRMTNDTLNRINADGSQELVGYCQEFFLADSPEAEREYYEHNRSFYAQVRAMGLGGALISNEN
jgi:hypothetical protein